MRSLVRIQAELWKEAQLIEHDVALYLRERAIVRTLEITEGDRRRANVDGTLAEIRGQRRDIRRELDELPTA